jgi:hypothetical protein
MRVAKLQGRIAVLAVMAMAGSACQTAQKPVSLLPAKTAPALTAAKAPASAAALPQASTTPQSATEDQPQTQAQPPAEAKPASPSPSPASDPVADLITKVENNYQAGLQAYQGGQTEIAKEDFDNAFNALLESNLDIRSDDRLGKEFDRIVDGVNHLDLGSLDPSTKPTASLRQPIQISRPRFKPRSSRPTPICRS